MPCTLPALLVGKDPIIYAPNNDGRSYNLGYAMGVNACGLLFFGTLFWRLVRLRRRLDDSRKKSGTIGSAPNRSDETWAVRHIP